MPRTTEIRSAVPAIGERPRRADYLSMDATVVAQTELTRTFGRLASALLGYFVLVTLVITLTPFDFARRPLQISWITATSDILANIALFIPLGLLTRSLAAGPGRQRWTAAAAAAVFSLLLETAQIFIAGRFVSPIDVASNTAGAWFGILFRDRLEHASIWRSNVAGRIGLDIPLVGLLYLLIPQLWLSAVGLVDDSRRSATILLLGAAGSIVLAALHRHRWREGVRLAAKAIPPLTLLWFTIGAMPTLASAPGLFAALALAVVSMSIWLLRPAAEPRERRFEADTLGRFVPVFTVYLVVAALWPPLRSLASWHGAIGFSDRLNDAAVIDVLLLLEQVGGFTLLGYAAAEWRGRRELTLAEDLPRVTLTIAAFALALEAVQGWLVGPGASLLRALLATAGATYGVAVYHLARTHVRVLRAGAPPRTIADFERAA